RAHIEVVRNVGSVDAFGDDRPSGLVVAVEELVSVVSDYPHFQVGRWLEQHLSADREVAEIVYASSVEDICREAVAPGLADRKPGGDLVGKRQIGDSAQLVEAVIADRAFSHV